MKKWMAKTEWYKGRKSSMEEKIEQRDRKESKGEEKKDESEEKITIETVLFVPYIPGSALVKILQEREDLLCKMLGTKCKIKFVERTGTKIVDLIGRKDPWAEMPCGRGMCLTGIPVKGNEREKERRDKEIETGIITTKERKVGTCQNENITYKIMCQTCLNERRDSHYIGESSRTAYIRGLEHLRDRAKKKDDSVLNKHDQNHHPTLIGGGIILHDCTKQTHEAPTETGGGKCYD